MNKAETKCKNMADVCRLAHLRTVRDCGFKKIQVDCDSEMKCMDDGQVHKGDAEWDECCTHYTAEAQEIFDEHYDYICGVTGI